jgi:hypothetical protein
MAKHDNVSYCKETQNEKMLSSAVRKTFPGGNFFFRYIMYSKQLSLIFHNYLWL